MVILLILTTSLPNIVRFSRLGESSTFRAWELKCKSTSRLISKIRGHGRSAVCALAHILGVYSLYIEMKNTRSTGHRAACGRTASKSCIARKLLDMKIMKFIVTLSRSRQRQMLKRTCISLNLRTDKYDLKTHVENGPAANLYCIFSITRHIKHTSSFLSSARKNDTSLNRPFCPGSCLSSAIMLNAKPPWCWKRFARENNRFQTPRQRVKLGQRSLIDCLPEKLGLFSVDVLPVKRPHKS